MLTWSQDCEAYRLQGDEQGWQLSSSLEMTKERPGMPAAEEEESARNMFRQMDLRGRAKDDTQLKTVHQNTVTKMRSYQEAGGSLKKLSSEFQIPYQYATMSPC